MQAEDINGLQLIIGEAISQPDVAYCFIKDGKGRVAAMTFETGTFPPALQNINALKPDEPFGTQSAVIRLQDRVFDVIDIASPIGPRGTLGTVHVGLNITLIKEKLVTHLTFIMLVGFVSLGTLAVLTLVFSSIIVSPVRGLMKVAEALGAATSRRKLP